MLTPQLDAIGDYKVAPPFTIAEGDIYRCEGVFGFEALEAMGVDVYATYYVANHLPPEAYAYDKDKKANIVTLIGINGCPNLHVPTTYITAVPSIAMVPYNRMVVSIDLGIIPDSLSLDGLMDAVRDVTTDVIGVNPPVDLHRVPIKGGISTNQHELLEINRNLAIKYRRTAHAEVRRLTQLLEKREAQIALLEESLIGLQASV